jgi:hypothetical protein
MTKMIAPAVLVLALLANPAEAVRTTHRRAAGTELFRVQPTQKVMPLADTTPMNHADFESLEGDAKRYALLLE